jgi:uncharacterized protein with FMN-binding domain
MRRVSLWFLSTVAVVALLFGYKTSTSGPTATAAAVASPTTSGTSTTADGAKTVTGSVAQTRWGPVQVAITVAGRDREINADALPVLVQSTLTAQNANIDMVSGATVTSTGYLQSLQSALDQAGLA